ncbi:hypothetical protein GCM10028808_57700 [Spirosoma migulaei]
MDHFEFYRELYHKENDRRQEVINSLNIPLALITALATGLYVLVTSFAYSVHWLISAVFIVFVVVTTITLMIAITYLSLAFIDIKSRFEYKGLPYAKPLFDWHKNLDAHYNQHFAGQPNVDKMADEEFKKYIINQFVESIDHNTFVNDTKHSHIFNSKKYIVYCLVSSLLTLLPFFLMYFSKEDEVHKVQIVKQASSAAPKPVAEAASKTLIQNGEKPTTATVSSIISSATATSNSTAGQAHQGGQRTTTTTNQRTKVDQRANKKP